MEEDEIYNGNWYIIQTQDEETKELNYVGRVESTSHISAPYDLMEESDNGEEIKQTLEGEIVVVSREANYFRVRGFDPENKP